MVQRASVQLFGPNEYALRLFPLLCGLASLFLFYYLAKKCLNRKAVPIAIALFAILLPLIYYSSEAKQYSSDVAVALCLLAVAAPLSRTVADASQNGFAGTRWRGIHLVFSSRDIRAGRHRRKHDSVLRHGKALPRNRPPVHDVPRFGFSALPSAISFPCELWPRTKRC